jgi:hypothetical protein
VHKPRSDPSLPDLGATFKADQLPRFAALHAENGKKVNGSFSCARLHLGFRHQHRGVALRRMELAAARPSKRAIGCRRGGDAPETHGAPLTRLPSVPRRRQTSESKCTQVAEFRRANQ